MKIKLSDEEKEEFKHLAERFREKFGRDMGPDDPIQPLTEVKRHLESIVTEDVRVGKRG